MWPIKWQQYQIQHLLITVYLLTSRCCNYSAERSFSKLKLIKMYLQITKSQSSTEFSSSALECEPMRE